MTTGWTTRLLGLSTLTLPSERSVRHMQNMWRHLPPLNTPVYACTRLHHVPSAYPLRACCKAPGGLSRGASCPVPLIVGLGAANQSSVGLIVPGCNLLRPYGYAPPTVLFWRGCSVDISATRVDASPAAYEDHAADILYDQLPCKAWVNNSATHGPLMATLPTFLLVGTERFCWRALRRCRHVDASGPGLSHGHLLLVYAVLWCAVICLTCAVVR